MFYAELALVYMSVLLRSLIFAAVAFAPVLGSGPVERSVRPDPALVPTITLDPPPDHWPDPDDYLPEE